MTPGVKMQPESFNSKVMYLRVAVFLHHVKYMNNLYRMAKPYCCLCLS
jgi:hypothetical protein